MKIGVLSSCQHVGLANCIRALQPDAQVISAEMSVVVREGREASIIETLNACDFVVKDPALECANSLSDDRFRDGTRFVKMPSVMFTGYHPDTIYIPTGIGYLQGACGPYHSRLAVAAFFLGYSLTQTKMLFNSDIFSKLGYFAEYAKSGDQLRESFRQWGFDINPLFTQWAKRGCFMHTRDHPKLYVLFGLGWLACQAMGLEPGPLDGRHELVPDDLLAGHPAMPVYPEIANAVGCEGCMMFKTPSDPKNIMLIRLHEFIDNCFTAYAKVPRNILFGGEGVEDAVRTLEEWS